MIGDYVMTQANCESRATVTDGVGMAAYTMDSHNCERLVVNGMVKNEGDVRKVVLVLILFRIVRLFQKQMNAKTCMCPCV